MDEYLIILEAWQVEVELYSAAVRILYPSQLLKAALAHPDLISGTARTPTQQSPKHRDYGCSSTPRPGSQYFIFSSLVVPPRSWEKRVHSVCVVAGRAGETEAGGGWGSRGEGRDGPPVQRASRAAEGDGGGEGRA